MRFFVFSINPSHIHTISSLFQFISIQILSCLQPSFPKLIESALAQSRPFPMDLHHSWGVPFAVEKKPYFSVHKVIRNRSIWRPCQFLILSPNNMWKPFLFFLILLFCFPEYDLKGGTSLSFDGTLYHRHILCMWVCNLISRNGLNQYCSI